MPWYARFDQPIIVNGRPALKTLAEARGYILELPQAERESVEWKSAEAMLSEAADRGGSHSLIARHAIARALLTKT